LNAILGFSELLIDATNGQFPDATRQRFLEQINTSGKHLLGLINDILDLSKIEAGQMELHLHMVSVADVANDVARTVEPLVAKKEIHLEVAVAGAGHVLADEGKLRQMVMNLLSNAIKFTPAAGIVKIEATRVAGRLKLSVSDSGIGIAPQDMRRVFQEFQQLDSGTNRKEQGTGLGLALTRRFAILHGGDVYLESEVGKGSRFTIDIPLEARSAELPPVATIASENGSSADPSQPLVMIVEDDPASAELLARQIERAGFRTDIARTGADAVAKAKQLKPAAITLDIMLPDVDGWEVLTRLKRDETTSDIPVIVISVVDNPALATALGALDHLVKPVEAKDIVNRLSNFNFKQRPGGRQTCILVVDDQSANRDWLKHVLEPAGFKVMLASGGQEAIDLARSGQPDVVLLDILMPEVNGFDVVDALQEGETTKAIPIMVLTVKHLTEGDTQRLHGRVTTILTRDATAATDVLGQLQVVLKNRAGVP
jgi:CheY-like chemotaxis protein/anti-sigma regulatory factor (Ser/Thr protein kinase)